MNRVLPTIAFVAILVAASTAFAWEPIASGSPVWDPPVPYFLNNAGSPDLGGFSGTEAEVRRGMDDWTRVSCTSLTTNYGGGTTARPGSYEGTSTIGWIESGWRHGSGAIGVTGPRWGRFIIEADMEMNGVNYTWITGSGRGGNVNAYSIILHEGGHWYGLGHSDDRGATMYFAYQGGIDMLGTDDTNGICALYPGSGGGDCTTTGCPSGQECTDGRCVTPMGDGMICAPCSADSECGGSSDFCLGYPDGRRYCGRACSSDADCDGDRCLSTSGGVRQCGRVVGMNIDCSAPAPGGCSLDSDCDPGEVCSGGTCMPGGMGADLGAPCGDSSECASNLCLNGACSSTCNFADPTGSCPGGFYCDAGNGSCDEGFCVSGSPGVGVLSAPCSSDTECASAVCENGRCSQYCIPDGSLGCPAGYACQVGTLPCRGSCQRSGTTGDPCETNGDCTSNICAVTEDMTFCTEFCDDATPCPAGFSCTPAGDASVCVPDLGGLGASCEANEECISNICAVAGGEGFCTRICDDATPCPGAEFDCVPTGTDGTGPSVCTSTAPPGGMDDGGCGCRVASSDSTPIGAPLLGAFFALLWGWRRRG